MAKKKSIKDKVLSLVTKVTSNDVVVRAFKTAVQTFVAGLLILDGPINKSALVALGASALSAGWNTIKEYRS